MLKDFDRTAYKESLMLLGGVVVELSVKVLSVTGTYAEIQSALIDCDGEVIKDLGWSVVKVGESITLSDIKQHAVNAISKDSGVQLGTSNIRLLGEELYVMITPVSDINNSAPIKILASLVNSSNKVIADLSQRTNNIDAVLEESL